MADAASENAPKAAMSGTVVELIVGIAAVTTTTLGLLGISPLGMAEVATILVGGALLFEGAAIVTRTRFRRGGLESDDMRRDAGQIGGTGMEVIGGIVGIALGVVALFGVAPLFLMPIALIVFGGALMFGSAGTARIHEQSPAKMASGVQLVAGVIAVALGILALLEFAPLTLSLVGLLLVSATVLLSGSVLGARLGRLSHHRQQQRMRSST